MGVGLSSGSNYNHITAMSLDETRIGVTIQKIALFQVSELIYPYIYILYVYIYIIRIHIYIYVELIFSIGAW